MKTVQMKSANVSFVSSHVHIPMYIALSDLNGNMSETSQRRVVIGRV